VVRGIVKSATTSLSFSPNLLKRQSLDARNPVTSVDAFAYRYEIWSFSLVARRQIGNAKMVIKIEGRMIRTPPHMTASLFAARPIGRNAKSGR
jgi:hypothetical protein